MEHYGEDLAAIHAAGFTAIASAAAAELLPRLAPGSRVLELGCGDGTTARLLSDAGHDVRALDSSPAFIELARARAPRTSFEIGSFVDAPLPPIATPYWRSGKCLATSPRPPVVLPIWIACLSHRRRS
jgi:SAM-dependent methyltransferase